MRVFRVTWFALLFAGAGTAFAQAPDPDVDRDIDIDVDVDAPPPPPPQPAQPVYQEPVYTQPIVEPTPIEDEGWSFERMGFGLTVGGGVAGFTNDTMRTFTDIGGGWSARVTLGTNSPLAFEAAYIGTLQNIEALGLDDDALLTGNGVQGALRLNATTDMAVQPFLYAGVGWRRYSITRADFNTSDIANDDDVLELPVGVGLAYKVGSFMLDARGELRPTFYEDMVPSLNDIGDDARMHSWGVNANLGFQF
jgi:hypothetical protein